MQCSIKIGVQKWSEFIHISISNGDKNEQFFDSTVKYLKNGTLFEPYTYKAPCDWYQFLSAFIDLNQRLIENGHIVLLPVPTYYGDVDKHSEWTNLVRNKLWNQSTVLQILLPYYSI